MRNKEKALAYYAQPVEIFHGDPADPNTCIKRWCDSGVHFREITIETGKGGEPVEIDQISDVHFNFCNEEDLKNSELAYTVQCRKWLAGGSSAPAAVRAMEAAGFADQIIVTGDTLDYLSKGAVEMTYKYIWDVDPDVLIPLGGHDVTRQMQTGIKDQTSLESRQAVVAAAWKHDIFYASRVVGDKAICVALDNGCGQYWDCQIEPLKADIEKARREGMVVLIFQHEPMSTGKPEDESVTAFRRYDPEACNFYTCRVNGHTENITPATKTVYDLITKNADVVRGVFTGHQHSCFYTEILGSYTDENGNVIAKTIPQPVLEANPYDSNAGHIYRIYVK